MKYIVLGWALVTLSVQLAGQAPQPGDSTILLQAVTVKAFETNRKLTDAPAAVTVLDEARLSRYSNISLVPALNTAPGVRMEERSPGSYRLNIRGSSLRSPFGVRNVKVYYNGIPYTDPGGNTFLNQLGFYNIRSMEIIREPGSSLYGAGTGGVILLNSEGEEFRRGATFDYTSGSYGTNGLHLNIRGGNESLHNSVHYQYLESDGYRTHTKMERKSISWNGVAKVGKKGVLRAHFLQGDLFYQTPGALTEQEFNTNPKAARPAAGQTPGSEEAQAAISQKMFLAGLNYSAVWNDHWRSSTSLYGSFSRLVNPTTRNYERRTEPHFGSRNIIEYNGRIQASKIVLLGGIETQQGFGSTKVYGYNAGQPGLLQSDDEITNRQFSIFTQGSLEFPRGWILTTGISLNTLSVEIQRLSAPASLRKRKYNNEFAPRLALLKKINSSVSAYASISKGFSPPTNAELLPSTGVISTALDAEEGTNLGIGIKGDLLEGRVSFDVSAFHFGLKNTIVQRRDLAGADYFVNAGSTDQNGLETFVSFRLLKSPSGMWNRARLWVGHTWHAFSYDNFIKVADDTADYSGNRLPGIPPHFLSAGLDLDIKAGAYANLSYFYSDPLPLNDANTAFASSYNLACARIGYRKTWCDAFYTDLFFAVDNIFDVKYSLGNDINAFGGRYYNAAPGVNYSAGVRIGCNW